MRVKFGKYLLIILLLNSYIICFASQRSNSSVAIAKNGILDLREDAIDEQIPLNGEWYFYWNQLLNPANEKISIGTIVEFPMIWNNHEQNGKKLPAFGYASYSLTVLLPKTDKPLSIVIPTMYSAYRLFINGVQVAENGKVSTTKKDFVPYWENQTVNLKTGIDTMKMVLQISNFAHSRGGMSKPLLLGFKAANEQYTLQKIATNLFLSGCLFMGGLFFLGLFLLGNKDKATLFFSFFCIIYTYRIIGTEDYILHTLFPGMNWYYGIRLEYLSLFLSVGIFLLYSRYLFKEDINLFITKLMTLVCFTFFALTLVIPPLYYTQLIYPFVIVAGVCSIYIPVVYLIAYKNKRPGSFYALLSSILLLLIFIIAQLYYWYLEMPLPAIYFSLHIVFFFLQSLILSKQISFTLNKARYEAEQGLKIKSEFLNIMSHEIRTPLNSVIGLNHLLLKKKPRTDQIEMLDGMLFSANNLLAIVNDILDYNKIESGKISFEQIEMDILTMSKSIIQSLKIAALEKGIDLNFVNDESINFKVLGDQVKLTQVLNNLIYNGIKFTNNGSVELILTEKEQTEKSITIEFRVKDTGIGISEEKQKLIFERFTQLDSSSSRNFGGTGLGLSISKKLLEQQNISLNIESIEGQGSEFYFVQTFEKCYKSSKILSNSIIHKSEKGNSLSGIAFLLVDDNAMNILVARKILELWGASVDVASDGLEALELVDPKKHNIILMDLNMPVMDGYESSKEMRAKGIKLPIIALTASLPKDVAKKVKESGIDEIIVKPYLPDELYRTIKNYLF